MGQILAKICTELSGDGEDLRGNACRMWQIVAMKRARTPAQGRYQFHLVASVTNPDETIGAPR